MIHSTVYSRYYGYPGKWQKVPILLKNPYYRLTPDLYVHLVLHNAVVLVVVVCTLHFVPFKHSCPLYLSTQSFVLLLGLLAKNSVLSADLSTAESAVDAVTNLA